ncbi:MAG: undecaprenyldiphospho-muramoylpentapeptide beta-N-acetylglucosaminyltransferase [Candidatus Omnitrophica bacterium]|nr:undecaprenyldiphospho-muramoylpentapeptide beta-N-acetylglucosaminyltransferase [Candidatus Omnitrophota bacterium]
MNANQRTPILICAGHTGGHFFPAVSFAEAVKALHPEVDIHMLMSRTPLFVDQGNVHKAFHLHMVPLSSPPHLFSLKGFFYLLKCTIVFWKTALLLSKLRPRLVVGFGSYGTVPGVLCAAGFKIPILLHEQNAKIGRANQFLARCAKRIATSFPEVKGQISQRKVFYSGFPLRSVFDTPLEPADFEKPPDKPFTVLVFGGSQGAKRLNRAFLDALTALGAEERAGIAVIHIVGNDDLDHMRQGYERLGIQADLFHFSKNIFEHYRSADLVISRAGAGTIFELAALGRAAILVPYPHAYAHQKINAQYLAQAGAARVIEDEKLDADSLLRFILELRHDRAERSKLEQSVRRLARPNASETLAEEGWKLLCQQD